MELGGSTDYRMTLELFSGISNTFKLDVVGLPAEINRYFLDPESENRLSQFQFTEGVNTRAAALRVFLPERPTSNVHIDEPLSFYAVAIPRERVEEIGSLQNQDGYISGAHLAECRLRTIRACSKRNRGIVGAGTPAIPFHQA